jgi:hypothetical protein
MNNETLFSERQRFRQIWLWIILLGINGIIISGLIKQLFLGEKFGNKPMSDSGIIIATIITLLLSVFFFSSRLETNIKTDGIYVRLFPIQLTFRFYSWDKLNQSYIRQYNAITEYGGWGFRGFRSNRALNVSGDKGIQLVFQDGSKLLIGTNRPDEARETLKRLGRLNT